MEFVILGFLMLKSLSQYDLLMAFSKEVSPFYKASLGSIQTRLNKLVKSNFAICKIDTSSNRKRKVYTITNQGRKAFNTWMKSEITNKNFEANVINKIFFLGIMKPDERKEIVNRFIVFMEEEIERFKNEKSLNNNKEIPEGYRSIFKYQIKTLELGIYQYENLLVWCKQLLKDIERDNKNGQD